MILTQAHVKSILWKTQFTFAKSMPKIPHEWTHKKDWDDDELFESVVEYIRENGIKERFFRKQYIYLYLNGYKYWTMGNPIETTVIINRARVSENNNDL